jgi:carbamoyl-phosphate synthase large subunit
MNSDTVTKTCSNKDVMAEQLRDLGIPLPVSVVIRSPEDYDRLIGFPYPCVVKPTTGTGGSVFVSIATSRHDAEQAITRIINLSRTAIVQEYLPLSVGEFTIGVLSLPDQRIVGSIAMKRLFHCKLSVLFQTADGLISSGYSQGLIDDFAKWRMQAESIARALGSVGPLNVQGRVKDGAFVPFEINPRFSASAYLRAMAGFNEIDMYLGYVLLGKEPRPGQIRTGYYLRSFSETFVPQEKVQ